MGRVIGQGHLMGPTTWSKKKNGKNSNFGIKKNQQATHHLWSWLIWCVKMKWRYRVDKIMSKSVNRQTGGQGETSIPPFQLHWSGGYSNIHYKVVKFWNGKVIVSHTLMGMSVLFHAGIKGSKCGSGRLKVWKWQAGDFRMCWCMRIATPS